MHEVDKMTEMGMEAAAEHPEQDCCHYMDSMWCGNCHEVGDDENEIV